ncbi:zinc finger protein 511 [Cotesia glomerata]|uniref:C2H2-type domain-containing protein n=1 Tax=Cotesia glomerata TaxID=32391 RepID=A0AAV7ILG6_COTGL|nr:zinc finger protein 511 [Cotesia glomerata]XP_044581039.1 zinc finger protein 511 [Cotesia glomerata]XP_044581040.1 zinc finger protein 511 [Cotesia glomerata]KAH0553992.1 hypothetical protein KQX54_006872 [Cotesia glomerata]
MAGKLSPDDVVFLKNIGVGTRDINDTFFEDSHRACKVFQRTGITIDDEEEFFHQSMNEFKCNAPGCEIKFDNLLDFEIHYNSCHRFTCAECKKINANARLLEIHIEENHDSFFKVLADKKPMHQCYVSDCYIKFKTSEDRKQHCIEVHKFPKLFKFDELSQKKTVKKTITHLENAMEVDDNKKTIKLSNNKKANDNKGLSVDLNKNQKLRTFSSQCKSKVDEYHPIGGSSTSSGSSFGQLLSSTMKPVSSLMFIPRQIMHKPHPQNLRRSRTIKSDIENDNLMELSDALPLV